MGPLEIIVRVLAVIVALIVFRVLTYHTLILGSNDWAARWDAEEKSRQLFLIMSCIAGMYFLFFLAGLITQQPPPP